MWTSGLTDKVPEDVGKMRLPAEDVPGSDSPACEPLHDGWRGSAIHPSSAYPLSLGGRRRKGRERLARGATAAGELRRKSTPVALATRLA